MIVSIMIRTWIFLKYSFLFEVFFFFTLYSLMLNYELTIYTLYFQSNVSFFTDNMFFCRVV